MPARRIYLVTTTGFPHYGDELAAAQWLRLLARTEPEAEVWVDCPSPGNSTLLLGHLHPRVRFVDTLFQHVWSAPSEAPEQVAEWMLDAVRHPGVAPRWAAGVELLHGVDVFHVVGGGYVNGIWPRHYGLLAAGALLSAEFGARSAMTGHGLTPPSAPDGLLDRLTSGYAVVDVRDPESRRQLSSHDVTETGDDCWLGLDDAAYDHRDSRSVMACVQSDFLDGDVETVADTVASTLQAWGVDGSKIGYVEAMPGPDRRVFDLIEPRFPGIRFYPFAEVWREGLPARRGQRWLTSRLQIHQLAAAAGAWGVALAGNAVSQREHESLAASGSRWDVVEWGGVPPRHHGDPGFGSRRAAMVEAKAAVAERIYRQ